MNVLLLKPAEAADQLRISRSRLYELMASGAIPSILIGKSRRVPAERLKEWVDKQLAEQQGEGKPGNGR